MIKTNPETLQTWVNELCSAEEKGQWERAKEALKTLDIIVKNYHLRILVGEHGH